MTEFFAVFVFDVVLPDEFCQIDSHHLTPSTLKKRIHSQCPS
jgi:hypothetical protein